MSIIAFFLGFIGFFILAAVAIVCFVLFLSDKSKKYLLALAIISTVIIVATVAGGIILVLLSIPFFTTNDETTFRNDLYALNGTINGTFTDYCEEDETCLDITILLFEMDTDYRVSINKFDEVDSIYDNSTVYYAEVFFDFDDESYEDITVIGNVVFNSDGISYDSDFYQNLFDDLYEQIPAFQTS